MSKEDYEREKQKRQEDETKEALKLQMVLEQSKRDEQVSFFLFVLFFVLNFVWTLSAASKVSWFFPLYQIQNLKKCYQCYISAFKIRFILGKTIFG